MKLIHLSDLHLGKRVNGFSMIEDQRYILAEILDIVDRERPEAVLIAGDVYDKPVPPAEAVTLLDSFLVELSRRETQVFVISGNHDSPERTAFGGRLMEASGVHMAPVYDGRTAPVTLTDEYGPVNLYLLPFVKPVQVRRLFPDQDIADYTGAMAAAIGAMGVDTSLRNVLAAHQFVTGAERCQSEEIPVGGLDNVDVSVFQPFDYVALGHLHGPQHVERETVRYCGSPLKYSFSEWRQRKSVTVVELGRKGEVSVREAPLTPLRDMVKLRGSYEEITRRDYYETEGRAGCYVHVTLTDEEDIPDAMAKLRMFYPWLMALDYDNKRTQAAGELAAGEDAVQKSPLELLDDFYEQQNGQPMGEAQRALAQRLIEEIWEGER